MRSLLLAAVPSYLACASAHVPSADPDGLSEACPRTDASALHFDVIRDASFVNGNLHIAGSIDSEERYLVLAPVAYGTEARVLASSDTLAGSAILRPTGDGTHVRVWASAPQELRVDVLDTSSDEPVLLSSGSFPIAPHGVDAFSADAGRVFVCVTPPGSSESVRALATFSLDGDPALEGWRDVYFCKAGRRAVTEENLWLSWTLALDPFEAADARVYSVGRDSAALVSDYNYNQTGIHQYGVVSFAATDGRVIVFDPTNEGEFFFMDALSQGRFVHARPSISGGEKLLAVHDARAYVATDDAVRAFDASAVLESGPFTGEWVSAPVSDWRVEVELDLSSVRVLASNDDYVAVTDGREELFLIPFQGADTVKPTLIYAPQERCPR